MSIESFMVDYLEATSVNPSDSRERAFNEVFLWLRPLNGAVRLANIRATAPGCGAGSGALEWLLSLANRHNVSIMGEAEPTDDSALDAAALKDWYRRHGFKVSSRGDIEYTPETEV